MRALDIDGDGKLSFDEAATFYFQDKEAPLKFVVPDFKKAYEIISESLIYLPETFLFHLMTIAYTLILKIKLNPIR